VWVTMGARTGLFLSQGESHMALVAELILLVLGLATSFAALFLALILVHEPLVPWRVVFFLVLFATWLFVHTGVSASRRLEEQK
jgi:hypothetical protein